MSPAPPTAILIAGPNGAGKTTFAREFLPTFGGSHRFLNADLIADGLAPFAPETEAFRAGRIMIDLITEAVASGNSFAVESTLSSRNYLAHVPRWQDAGFHVILIFISLNSPDLAVHRVTQRVREGGHHIPTSTIIRRFQRGKALRKIYCQAVNEWYHYDNSSGRFILQSSS